MKFTSFNELVQRLFRMTGINFARNSRALGLTSGSEFRIFMSSMFPVDNGHALVRIGPNGDGGYVLPDDFEGINYCFSPGSDLLWEFEREIGDRFKIVSHICDSLDKKPENLGELQVYNESWLGPFTSGKYTSLADWIRSSIDISKSGDWLLQIDIEGAEYLSLLAVPEDILLRFRVIILEAHSLDALMNRFSFEEFLSPFFQRLMKDFDLVHLHGNNCCGLWEYEGIQYPRIAEFTWHRKDRRLTNPVATQVKTELDFKNLPSKNDLIFERPNN